LRTAINSEEIIANYFRLGRFPLLINE